MYALSYYLKRSQSKSFFPLFIGITMQTRLAFIPDKTLAFKTEKCSRGEELQILCVKTENRTFTPLQ